MHLLMQREPWSNSAVTGCDLRQRPGNLRHDGLEVAVSPNNHTLPCSRNDGKRKRGTFVCGSMRAHTLRWLVVVVRSNTMIAY